MADLKIMADIGRTRASLRIFGDDLNPDEISALLGTLPSSSARKGEISVGKGGFERTARTGGWSLEAVHRQPGSLDRQIVELLSPLNPDTEVWRRLVARFRADIFCGLFINEMNQGLELRPETLEMIAARGLSLAFDIYCLPPKKNDGPKGEAN